MRLLPTRRRRNVGDSPAYATTGRRDDVAATRDPDAPGASLARPPALIVGTILLAYGLLGFLTNADFPKDVPHGFVQGESWLGIEVNGWTNFFTAVAGGLLLFGAAQHLLAKAMSLLVGLALAACAVFAIVDGDDVLGLAAANNWTKLGWAISAAVLLVTALLPRAGARRRRRAAAAAADDDGRLVRRDQPIARTGRFDRTAPEGRPAAEPGERVEHHTTTGS